MTIITLIKHQWKESVRSSFWQKSLAVNILLALLSLYLISVFVSIGYFADEIVKNIFKDRPLVEAFTGLLFYFFIIDLLMRFMMQKLPVLSIIPYLTLPVKKRTLLNYPLIRTITGMFNIYSLLLILPFFFKVVVHELQPAAAMVWVITIMAIILTNNFIAFTLKKYMSKKPLVIVILLIAIAFVFYLDVNGTLPLSEGFARMLGLIERNPVTVILPLLALTLSYSLAYGMLKRNAYIEDNNRKKTRVSSGFSFLSKYGETGSLMQNELRLLSRNKRPKSMIWLGIILLCYGMIFYSKENINKDFFLIFAGIFLTSGISFTYGQMVFSWESSFFDAITANKISPYNYLKSKYFLFAGFNIISFIVTLPYGFIDSKIIFINTALFFYNTGVSMYILILFGTFNIKSIDLGKSQFMNYEGTNIMQFLLVLPLFGLPFAFVALSKLFLPDYTGYIILLLMGLLGIIFNEYVIRLLLKVFLNRRYKMAEGYRKK